jgi:hypothetical protein
LNASCLLSSALTLQICTAIPPIPKDPGPRPCWRNKVSDSAWGANNQASSPFPAFHLIFVLIAVQHGLTALSPSFSPSQPLEHTTLVFLLHLFVFNNQPFLSSYHDTLCHHHPKQPRSPERLKPKAPFVLSRDVTRAGSVARLVPLARSVLSFVLKIVARLLQKCDEQPNDDGECNTCVRLHLECLGFGAKRPEWLRVSVLRPQNPPLS